ncbi:MAG: hypothetical protein H0X26_01535 [Alphaproteobacteria bacterium]|nr:hypothetical protein [Alphaproteobacteria bacterium]
MEPPLQEGKQNLKIRQQSWCQSLGRISAIRDKSLTKQFETCRNEVIIIKNKIAKAIISDIEKGTLIPKEIYYIWIGGPIDEEYWHDITRTAQIAASEKYRVTVWVDDPDNLHFIKEKRKPWPEEDATSRKWKRSFNEQYDRFCEDTFKSRNKKIIKRSKIINVRNIHDLKSITPEFFSDHKNLYRQYWRFIQSETVGLYNYAAAADLLRYLILLEGGVYLDTDVPPLAVPCETETFLGDIKLPLGFRCFDDNNPIILSSKMNPVIMGCVMGVLENYLKFENNFTCGESTSFHSIIDRKRLHGTKEDKRIHFPEKQSIKMAQMFLEKTDRWRFTIGLSGPGVTKKAREIFESSDGYGLAISRAHKDSLNIYCDRLNLKEAHLEAQKLKDNERPNKLLVLEPDSWRPEDMFSEPFQNSQQGRGNLKNFINYYIDKPGTIDKVSKIQLDFINNILKDVNVFNNTLIKPVRIGKKFFVESKCDKTWTKGSNPRRAFTTDDIKRPKGPFI